MRHFLLSSLILSVGLTLIPGLACAQGVDIPESISLGQLANVFHPVDFPHRDHAHMLETGTGCRTCHHYADDEIYDPCADCHTNRSEEQTPEIPSLNAAFHRKCLGCHRQWSRENVCGSCHIKRNQPLPEAIAKRTAELERQRAQYPARVLFETTHATEPQVLFRHDEHVELFRFDCSNCHRNESCTSCHGRADVPQQILGMLPDHHTPCNTCHDTEDEESCTSCHREEPSPGFTHDLTGFHLKEFHARQECTACHDPGTPVQKLDRTCTNCHKNFVLGEFDHEATGLVLELGHEELDCYDCHLDENFNVPPSCYECHEDEVSFPEDLPGYRLDD